jgi:hypothetical protein
MPIVRPSRHKLVRHAGRAAVVSCAFFVCAAPALSSLSATPTLVSWDRAADASCNNANVAIEELADPSSLAIEVNDLTEIVTIGSRETTALAAIPSPPSDARTIASFLSLSRAGGPLGRDLITAYRDSDAAKVTALVKRSTTLNDEYNALAVRLGARTCAINPQPGTLHGSSLPTA